MSDMNIADFHAHILPGADHGSPSSEISLFQLRTAYRRGVRRIVATPHFYPHLENVDTFINRRNASYKRIESKLTSDLPQIWLGAEILICDNIEKIPMLDSLCISGTRAILLELPFNDFFDSYVFSVKSLVNDGYTVILAHADRYPPDVIDKLLRVGALIQLNADSLSGLFIPKHLKRWIADKKVCAIGSDIHGRDKNAYKRFNRAIKKLGDNADFIKLTSDSILHQ